MRRKIAILGPGLLGGSLMLDLKKRGGCKIAVWGRREKVVREVLRKKMAHEASTKLEKVVAGADVIILCVPIGVMAKLVKNLLPHIKKGALVTDVGSVKSPVEKQLAPLLKKKARWIGSHPMAGSEQAGFSAARKNLFQGAPVILTPTKNTDKTALRDASKFWRTLGMHVMILSPEKHDRLVGEISHLPHLVAALLVLSASKESLPLAGMGFRDTTRIAAGPAEMWCEILMQNRKSVLKTLNQFSKLTAQIKKQLSSKKCRELEKLLSRANNVRQSIRKS